MDEMEQAYKELERIQDIITRHEGHMFALRGWLLAILGGLLAAYYTANIDLSVMVLRIAMLLVAALFLVLETRHVNLIEAVVERATAVEELIRRHRNAPNEAQWYDGPRVNEACFDGARRKWPKSGMTFLLNLWFYFAVIVVVIITTVSLPAKGAAQSGTAQEGNCVRVASGCVRRVTRRPLSHRLSRAPCSESRSARARPTQARIVTHGEARGRRHVSAEDSFQIATPVAARLPTNPGDCRCQTPRASSRYADLAVRERESDNMATRSAVVSVATLTRSIDKAVQLAAKRHDVKLGSDTVIHNWEILGRILRELSHLGPTGALDVATTIQKGANLKGTPVVAKIGKDILVGVVPLEMNIRLG